MFRVEWIQSALDELARLWTQADAALRQGLSAAGNEIDRRLQRNPVNEGESRPEGRRITFVAPLAVTFRADVASRTVTVIEIRLFRPRGR
jgi:hypothetical protein